MLDKFREYRRENQKRTSQGNGQHWIHKTKKRRAKPNTICIGHHYTQTNTNNVNKIIFRITEQHDMENPVFM
jgi:hypothetical protein